MGVCVQPVALSQASTVHELPSSQSTSDPPTQSPPRQASSVVHASPSSAFGTWTQPVAGSHASAVQALSSLQSGGAPPRQAPPVHVSVVEHGSPSSHGSSFGTYMQPSVGSHASAVQTSSSLQSGAAP